MLYVDEKCSTSSYRLERLLPKGKNKKFVDLIKDELGGKIMKEFVGLTAKTYNNVTDNNNESKKAKGTQNMS